MVGVVVEVELGATVKDVRICVDWGRVKAMIEDSPEEPWYDRLGRNDAYEKLIDFRRRHLRCVRICPSSKRWWNNEISRHAEVVRGCQRLAGSDGRVSLRNARKSFKTNVRMAKETKW